MKTTTKILEGVMNGVRTKLAATMVASLMMLSSSGLQAAGKGTSGAQFLRIGVGARGPGMAGAIAPIADDATAIYYNPAGMARLERKEVQLGYNAYFKDTAAQFIGYGHPMNNGVLGLGLSMFGVKDIEKRSATGGDADTADLGNFNTRDMALSIGWAGKRAMGPGRLHLGAAVKYISSDLEVKTAKTGALDMGAIYSFRENRGLSLSLAVLNLGGKLKFDKESDPLPLNVKPGLAWKRDFERMGRLTAALDADLLVNDGIAFVQPGLEWWAHPSLALRTGYQFGRDEDAGSGLGAGVGLKIMNLGIDYAFVPYGDLGDTHRISLGMKF
jgi:hypothetical protein